jgi:hypothetical protein
VRLNIIYQTSEKEDMEVFIENHFNTKIRWIQLELSMFEQYQVRSTERVFIPKIWSYRIVHKNGQYIFGTL